jgi:hypothetical protein
VSRRPTRVTPYRPTQKYHAILKKMENFFTVIDAVLLGLNEAEKEVNRKEGI